MKTFNEMDFLVSDFFQKADEFIEKNKNKNYKIHEVETNVTYDDLYSSVEEAEKVIEDYKADDEDREVTYEIIEA